MGRKFMSSKVHIILQNNRTTPTFNISAFASIFFYLSPRYLLVCNDNEASNNHYTVIIIVLFVGYNLIPNLYELIIYKYSWNIWVRYCFCSDSRCIKSINSAVGICYCHYYYLDTCSRYFGFYCEIWKSRSILVFDGKFR